MSSLLGFVSKKSQRNYHSWESMDFYRGHACAQIMKTIFHKISCVMLCRRHRPLNNIHIDMRKSSKSNVLYSHQSQSCCGHHNQSVNPSGVKSQQHRYCYIITKMLECMQWFWPPPPIRSVQTRPDHINEACDAVFIFFGQDFMFSCHYANREAWTLYTILSNDTPSLAEPNQQCFFFKIFFTVWFLLVNKQLKFFLSSIPGQKCSADR